jgi:hypothetical protein
MTILHFGSEMDAFTPMDGACFESTDASVNIFGTVRDATYTRAAIFVQNRASGCDSGTFTATADFYHQIDMSADPFPDETTLLEYFSGSTLVAKLTGQGASAGAVAHTLRLYLLTSVATFTQVGSDVDISSFNHSNIGVHINAGTGLAELYVAKSQRTAGTLSPAFATIDRYRPRSTGATYWSQSVASTESLLGKVLQTIVLDTNSATNTGMTGDVTDINEAVYSDVGSLSSAAANQVSTFFKNGLSTTGEILGIGVSARVKAGGSGPQNDQMAIRSSGTNFFSSTKALSVGYSITQNMFETDPATAAAWVNADAEAAEVGIKSIA